MIVVGKVDDVFLQVSCEKHIAYELNEFFSSCSSRIGQFWIKVQRAK